MPSTIASLAAELRAVQAVLEPIAAAYNSALSSDANRDVLEQAFREHDTHAENIVSAMVGQEPQSARDALSLALVILDYAVFDGAAAGVGSDGTRNHVDAARALVRYLAREAGIAPADLGIFRETLALAEHKDGPPATAN